MSSDQLKGGDGGCKVPVLDPPPDPRVCMLPDGATRRAAPGRAWSRIEKGLVCALTAAGLVISVLLFVIFVREPLVTTPDQAPCGNIACVRVAGEVLSKADLEADPCVDFYQYACGGWLSELVLPADRSRVGVASKPVEQNQLRLKAVLEGAGDLLYGNPSSAVRKAKDFYNSCITYKDLRGGAHNISTIIRHVGSWTVTRRGGHWDEVTWDLERALFSANQYQVWPLFDRDVRQDLYDSRNMIITFSPPNLSAPGTIYYLGAPANKFRAAFNALFSQVALVLGADNKTALVEADLVWLLERRLAEILREREHANRQELYRKLTLRELQNATGNWIDLGAYLSLVHESPVSPEENVVCMDLEYMKRIHHVVRTTPRSTLANYVVWRVVKSLIPHAGADFRSSRLRFKQAMEGVSDLGASWDACIDTTTQVMGQATGAMFAENYLSEDGKEKALELLRLLKAAFLDNLPRVDWMVESTRRKAAAKLRAMVDMVGYGKVAASAEALDKYYQKMTITNNNAFGNWIEAVNFHFRRVRGMRGKPRDRTDWGYTSPTAVNAFYQQGDNAMMFPAGILRPPFFDNSYPMAMNLGAIGTVMAHELSHGFDDQGRRYNNWGSLRDWWDNVSRDAFNERAKCFVNQYSQYKVAGLRVNGELTLSENIADNGAVRTAYSAYGRWRRGGGEQAARLPGANVTEDQTFFLAYAQLFCTYYTPEFATRLLYTDTHTPAKYRVIGALSNFEKFSEAFNCKPKAPMNPTNKCRLW